MLWSSLVKLELVAEPTRFCTWIFCQLAEFMVSLIFTWSSSQKQLWSITNLHQVLFLACSLFVLANLVMVYMTKKFGDAKCRSNDAWWGSGAVFFRGLLSYNASSLYLWKQWLTIEFETWISNDELFYYLHYHLPGKLSAISDLFCHGPNLF